MENPPLTFGKYRLLGELGRGETGIVFHAIEQETQRRVALKILSTMGKEAPDIRLDRFLREAQTMASLCDSSPYFVKVHLIGEEQGRQFIVREFVEGISLKQRAEAKNLPLWEGLSIIAHVAKAMERMHQAGLAHRNLLPENILIGMDAGIKLIGFGKAGVLESPDFPHGLSKEIDLIGLKDLTDWVFKVCGVS